MFGKKAKKTEENSFDTSEDILDTLDSPSVKEEKKVEEVITEDILNTSNDFLMADQKVDDTIKDNDVITEDVLGISDTSGKEEKKKKEEVITEDLLNITNDFSIANQKVDDTTKDSDIITEDVLDISDTSGKEEEKVDDLGLVENLEDKPKKKGFFGKAFSKKEVKSEDILDASDSSGEEKDDLGFMESLEDKSKKKGFFSKIFSKKEVKIDENINEDIKSTSSNIFEDFDLDSELGKEVKDIQTNLHKDTFYYLLKFVNIFKYFNILMIIILGFTFYYTIVQNDSKIKNESILDPVCDFILGEGISSDLTFCSSISYINEKSKEDEISLKKDLYRKMVAILPKIYKNENFLNSKEIIFLLENGEERLRPLDILSEFDKLKNEFESIDKARIACDNMKIDIKGVLTTSCTVFSSDWESEDRFDKEKGIVGFDGNPDGKKVSGTSISVAASFFNFLENKPSNLILLEKPKTFSSTDTVGDNTGYTKRTSFDIVMQYKTNSIFY